MKALIILTFLQFIILIAFGQNVGIGTANPVFKLDVRNGSINTDSVYRIESISVISTKGSSNTFVGKYAGKINSGVNNSFSGFEAGQLNGSGSANSFYGSKSGYLNNTGSFNSFFGEQSGHDNSDGAFNSFFGRLTGYKNSSGSHNSFFGRGAGYNTSTGSSNSFFGGEAGAENRTGVNNTAIGLNTLNTNMTGDGNTALGYSADVNGIASTNATAIGAYARVDCNNCLVLGSVNGINEGTSNVNVGIGTTNPLFRLDVKYGSINTDSVYRIENITVISTKGSSNTFVGKYAGKINSGANNSFSGFEAGQLNGSGSANSFYGSKSGYLNNTGSFNSFFGEQSGHDNSDGAFNSFFGRSTGYKNSSGSHNSFFGRGAGYNTSTGSSNSFFGGEAGAENRTGVNNTAIGLNTLNTNTTGSGNTALGYSADVNGIALTNATAIGANARVDCNNCMVLGSVNGINGGTSNINVGIGNNNPALPLSFGLALGDKISLYGNASSNYGFGVQGALLQIHADVAASDIAFGYGSSSSFTERMRIKGNGNVGIGLNNPLRPLSFAALLGKKISLYPGGTGDAGIGVFNAELRMHSDHSGADITFGYDDYSLGYTERMRIKGNGFVGIGTNSPGYILDVNGRMRIRSGGTNGTSAGLWLNNNANNSSLAFFGMENDSYAGMYCAAGFQFKMNVTNGNVAVGSGDPTEKLTVHGNIQANGNICYTGTNGACSDIRYKTNLNPLTSSLANILMLNGFYYDWKRDSFADKGFSDQRQIGFAAQDIEKLYPEIVQTDPNGYKSVDYGRLTPVLVEGMKEQQIEIDSLSKQNIDLQNQIDNQQSQMDELKRKLDLLLDERP